MPAHSDLWILLLLLVLPHATTLPATPEWPSGKDMERARKAHPMPDLKDAGNTKTRGVPSVTATPAGVDIQALAERHVELYSQHRGTVLPEPSLRVFVSFSMPQEPLRLLVAQAEQAGAVLVLRGLKDNSMTKTAAAAQALIGARKVGWEIDPEAFARYGIRHVPSFVLMPAAPPEGNCADSCPLSHAFLSVAGDVSLDYALATMVRRHPEASSPAGKFLKRLRSAP